MPERYRLRLGKTGEDLACRALRRRGYEILDRRYRTRAGELDIIARENGTLVFVEVKTRSSARFGHPFDAVTRAKQRKLVAMADDYLARKGWQGRPCRFDVVGLSMRETGDRPWRSSPTPSRRNGGLEAGEAVCYGTFAGWESGNNSVVECDLAKVEVAGSNPVSRSIKLIVADPCAPTSARRYVGPGRPRPLRAPSMVAGVAGRGPGSALRPNDASSSPRRTLLSGFPSPLTDLSSSQISSGRRRQVVRQRSAKPPSPVQIRAAPPVFLLSLQLVKVTSDSSDR